MINNTTYMPTKEDSFTTRKVKSMQLVENDFKPQSVIDAFRHNPYEPPSKSVIDYLQKHKADTTKTII